ncbi:MAG: PolC-type DNA polymerase III, partial [Lachnospiraceae bacterium]|nr:PolC-type DNA polymerase III [Lachnospiraceae bacterium]
ITELTSITDEMVHGAKTIRELLPEFFEFIGDSVLVAHNARFDTGFIREKAKQLGLAYDFTVCDTLGMARFLLPHLGRYNLGRLCREFGVDPGHSHRAVDDAEATVGVFLRLLDLCRARDIDSLAQLEEIRTLPEEAVRQLHPSHCIVLAKNDLGRIHLYKIVSEAHLKYFHRVPLVPKSLLMENREGLIIGSACEAGELFQAVVEGRSDEEIRDIVGFYDYLEIQPIGNNAFMIDDPKRENVNNEEDLRELNRQIVRLGEQYGKPVCATCDVHFLDPEDEIYRRIIQAGKGYKDCDRQPPLYLRTTDEMLEEFSYLGEEKAYEVVVANTNDICDRIEVIDPVRPDKCPPVIEDSDKTLTEICYAKAHSMYGDPLPEIVESRLEKELHSIISNGFAVMYIIAQKLVWKSNEDGYLVGSRGSVGSSFVATMSGITEVNPLPAHYYCRKCHFSDFDSPEVKKFAGSSGFDMPDRLCPVCGEPLVKDGHDIPFETFLGFYGDKEPDIDLNFSGEYQSHAHAYTEVIFGEGHTFRAGTIGTLADKTAYGYAMKYFEERGITKRKAEIDRLSSRCVGVKRTTGQHPGGIVVLPHGEEIYYFTPVQRPANDTTTNIITTHFDYHSIDHNLLKLDILGHDDPTMIRRLEDLTGLDAKTIPMDDPGVLSLFEDTSALGISPEDIDNCDLGCLGVPEMGTSFVMQMLRDTKPKCFSDLIRISGLSHGTDVWLNNAQEFIAQKKCTLSTAICTRDDIMTFLIYQGVEKGHAFKIMESVRKGRGLSPDMEKEMIDNGVPDWYIESCKRIKYMFPKAHAVAYVMMALRIAYFKIYYPLAYYAAYFSIRAKAFNYELMCQGKEKLEYYLRDYKRRANELSPKEDDTLGDMRLVQEMYARGLTFAPIDLFRSDAVNFQIVDGKLLPPFTSVDGLGEAAAYSIKEAAAQGPFLSVEDFKTRAKVSQTIADTLAELGVLGDIPKTNQISLDDLFSL